MDSIYNLTKECLILLEKHNLLKPLIQQEILSKILENTVLDIKDKDSIKKLFIEKKQFKNNEEFDDWLISENLEEEEFLEKISKPFKLNQHCKEKFSHKSDSRFLERKSELDQVIYSLVRVKSLFEANELYLRVQEKEECLCDVAKEHSQGDEKNTLGVIGPVPMNQGHPSLSEVLKSNAPGALVPPFKVESWWLFLRIESVIEAKLDENMETKMSNELFQEWLEEETDLIMSQLKISK